MAPSAGVDMADCQTIEQVLLSSSYAIVMHIHLVLHAVILISIAALIRSWAGRQLLVHGNLMLIIANIVFLYSWHTLAWFIYLLRYRILLFYYKDPCQLLTPVWMASLFYGPYYAYSVAFPALHFTATMERIRATFNAEQYELLEGRRLIVCCVLGIWAMALGYMGYVIGGAVADTDAFGHPLGVVLLTSKYNAQPILIVTMVTLGLIFCTAFCDWRIFVLNKRKRAIRTNANSSYNLSRNYQLNENAATLRLILPLDFSYALLYPVYIALVLVIRSYKSSMSTVDYAFYYHMTNTLLFLHSAVTILAYIRFVRSAGQRRTVDVKPTAELGKFYFKQLEAQWG